MMEEFTELIAGWLVTFGISFSFASLEGPFSLFKKVRHQLEKSGLEWISGNVQCPICWSFWLGICVAYCLDGGVVMWLSSLGFVAAVVSLSPDSDD